MREFIVGTRKSKLALIQTNWVVDQLRKVGVDNHIKIKEIDTSGDKKLNVSLPQLGGRGVFLEELEQALVNEEIDFAVHSLKDIPVELPAGLAIPSIPVREDHRDALLNDHHQTLSELPQGSVVGTSSVRRAAQLLKVRPDLQTKWIRGPIDSRIDQMVAGDYDAIVLAMAGLNRLSIGEEYISEILSETTFVPAMGQGALAIECRDDDSDVYNMLRKINDEATEKAVKAERTLLDILDEEEQAPIGAYAYMKNGLLHLHGMVIDLSGQTVLEYDASGEDATLVAKEVADHFIQQGALDIIAAVKQELEQDGPTFS